jgi:hypothetical protein
MAKMLINIHKLALLVHLIENADTNDFRKYIQDIRNGNTY